MHFCFEIELNTELNSVIFKVTLFLCIWQGMAQWGERHERRKGMPYVLTKVMDLSVKLQ